MAAIESTNQTKHTRYSPVQAARKVERPEETTIGNGAAKVGTFLTSAAAEYTIAAPLVQDVVKNTAFQNNIMDEFQKYGLGDLHYPSEAGAWLNTQRTDLTNSIINWNIPGMTEDIASKISTSFVGLGVISVAGAAGAMVGPIVGIPLSRISLFVRNCFRRLNGDKPIEPKYTHIRLTSAAAGGAIGAGLLAGVQGGIYGATTFGVAGGFAGAAAGLFCGILAGAIGGGIGAVLYNLITMPFRSNK